MFLKELILIKQVDQKRCDIFHYWYFLNKGYTFQPKTCNRCHVLLMIPMSLSNIAISNIRGYDYFCTVPGISKYEAIKSLQYINLTEKNRTL